MIDFNPKNINRWMMMGTRYAFGSFLTDLAANHPKLFAITADFTKSAGLTKFKELYPSQFLTTGIAEQNMVSLASGLASEGYNVFACCFASFLTTRCYEQIKVNLGCMQHNVKLVGIASGLGASYQGNTHYGLDDVSLMRTIPNMTIVVPSDCTEVAKATLALAEYNGPAYLRLIGEGIIPVVNEEDYDFEIGKGIKKREGKDVLIISNGTMVSQSLKVAEELSENYGVEASVINMHTVKPLDTHIIDDNLNGKKLIVTIEEGLLNGGLGSSVADYMSSLGKDLKIIRLGINDFFPCAGSYNYLLEQCGLDIKTIVHKIIANIDSLNDSHNIVKSCEKCINVDLQQLRKNCFEMKLKALDMALSTSFGAHIGGGFSAMEIMGSLYTVASIPSMADINRDRIIVSKGHGVLAYYTALWKKGFISEDELATFETDGTLFHGHPHKNLEKGIEFSGGSLGLGISYAVGVAKACQKKGLNNTIYVLLGDGEMDEGIVWEALMSISNFGLNNMTLIVDRNNFQLDGPTDEIMKLTPLEDKLKTFGLDVDIVDGHSIEALVDTLQKKSDKPRAIIANTVKAHGISFLENNKISHQCTLNKKKYEQAIDEIRRAYDGE